MSAQRQRGEQGLGPVLKDSRLEEILARIPRLTVGVLGDLFLDRYLDIDATLTEPSLETGLDAFQVVRVRPSPGAAGTVINNLVALGVKQVHAVAVIGDDGEGYELTQVLHDLGMVDTNGVFLWESRRTPTYTKPMLHCPGEPPRELNRLDIKNRTPMPAAAEDLVLRALGEVWPQVDALIVLDQVSETDCGVVTSHVRRRLAELGDADPGKLILADSRERIGLFRSVCLKPNLTECRRAVYGSDPGPTDDRRPVLELARRAGRPVFCTAGSRGILLADPRQQENHVTHVAAYPVMGPIDPVGAGDSTSAGIACAVAAGATLEEAAAFGNLVASITIPQIGTTGTASPEQVRQCWRELSSTRLA
jgi:bifunctional ADP-heptose synthase (sugar kinase/adenylyltransferase)